ncbi:kinetochore Sim4 complex subunit Fta4 [Phyllosticta capitalensis]
MSGTNTVVDLKSAFIRRQTRILSQPLQAPQQWKDDCEMPDAAIRSAMREVNRRLTRHNKIAYSTIAIRHTAEQIDALYWQSTAPKPSTSSSSTSSLSLSNDSSNNPFRSAADLTSPTTIAALPPSWDDVDPEQAQTLSTTTTSTSSQRQLQHAYTTRTAHLRDLSSRRAAARLKLARLKALKAALRPLADPAQSVQPNLATRDGELAAEVARMKTLGVRVAARVGERVEARSKGEDPATADGEDEVREEDGSDVLVGKMSAEERQRRKLEGVLNW